MKEQIVTTSIRIEKSVLDKLQEIADNDPRISSRMFLIKTILLDYLEAK